MTYNYINGQDWFGDCLILESWLDEMKFYSGTERLKMWKHSNHTYDGGSMLYGYTWKGYMSPTMRRTLPEEKGVYQTQIVDKYPEFQQITREFMNEYFPEFQWCNIQLNKNFPCPKHTDSKNVGTSIIIGLGDYTGGDLVIETPDVKESFNIKYKSMKFDGSKYPHWVMPFQGKRYSMVFFKNQQVFKGSLRRGEGTETVQNFQA